MTTKIKLSDVLALGNSMRRLEPGLQFNVRGALRWGQARKAIVEAHLDPFVKEVLKRANGGEAPTKPLAEEQIAKVEAEMFDAINGEEVELILPEPIPLDYISTLNCSKPEDYDALSRLVGVVLAPEPKPE